MKKTWRLCLSIVLGCLLAAQLFSSCLDFRQKKGRYLLKHTGDPTVISILTFNILSTVDLLAVSQGYPIWLQRRENVFAEIMQQNADIIAIEECSPSQFDQFLDKFGDSYKFAHHREFTTDAFVMFRKDRFELIEKGFWILEEPVDVRIRRLAVWVKVREVNSKKEIMFVGTHLDAKDIKEREIKFLKQNIFPQQESGAPLFMAGDFNITPDHDNYTMLVGGGWHDSYIASAEGEQGTYTFVNPTRRIDHIFYFGSNVIPLSWKTLGSSSLVLSDHRPVLATFHLGEGIE
ncbi:MAG: endonuclease/exonuclease/phosphatase family protein [Deltaproteobacteria bacterium]|nr:endonuclease/exonuclease/phosphatase family protein [Deltaproteobacteria bacterium]